MCTLVLWFDPRDGSLRVGANRDEAYARPSEPPARLPAPGALFGGRDAVAGGTWLALRQAAPSRLVALLNRREHVASPEPAPTRLSRGRLCLEAGSATDLAEIADRLRDRIGTFPVAPFTLLAAEPGTVLAHSFDGGALAVHEIAPGLHAWTHDDADDPHDPRVQHVLAAGRELAPGTSLDRFVAALLPALAAHDGERPVCLHGARYGTVSAAFLSLASDGRAEFRFAAGPPCTTPLVALPLPDAADAAAPGARGDSGV